MNLQARGFFFDVDVRRAGLRAARSANDNADGRVRRRHPEEPRGQHAGAGDDCGRLPIHGKSHAYSNISVPPAPGNTLGWHSRRTAVHASLFSLLCSCSVSTFGSLRTPNMNVNQAPNSEIEHEQRTENAEG